MYSTPVRVPMQRQSMTVLTKDLNLNQREASRDLHTLFHRGTQDVALINVANWACNMFVSQLDYVSMVKYRLISKTVKLHSVFCLFSMSYFQFQLHIVCFSCCRIVDCQSVPSDLKATGSSFQHVAFNLLQINLFNLFLT